MSPVGFGTTLIAEWAKGEVTEAAQAVVIFLPASRSHYLETLEPRRLAL